MPVGFGPVFDFVLKPVRSALQVLNEDTVKPLQETERDTLDAVKAIEHATQSIERHVEVIETLATSVGPLTSSVDRLNETMRDLVAVLGPLAAAEHEVHRAEHDVEQAEHFLRFGRRRKVSEPDAPAPEGS
ncbi:MAG TPA: hypothetical protein VME22_08645 [Solirubrobacteraceae bacterium]|nr:hypothetical protein [Solirubrobacteraceae bacterium]